MNLLSVSHAIISGLFFSVSFGFSPVQASSILSVQTGKVLSQSNALSALPDGALVLQEDEVSKLEKQTRTMTCEELYGRAQTGVTMEGGPVIEHRFETGFEQDSAGNFVFDSRGGPRKTYSTWLRESGQCLRHHRYTRASTPCPKGTVGVILEIRSYTMIDKDVLVNDTGWLETSRTCSAN